MTDREMTDGQVNTDTNPIEAGNRKYESKIVRLKPVWTDLITKYMPFSEENKQLVANEKVLTQEMLAGQFEQVLNHAQSEILPETPEGIGFRAILTSGKGTVLMKFPKTDESYEIVDMTQTIAQGGDSLSEKTRVSQQKPTQSQIELNDHYRVYQYLIQGAQDALRSDDERVRENVQPAILVYDLSKLEHVDGGGYSMRFKDPESKSDALLALYPIDISPAL